MNSKRSLKGKPTLYLNLIWHQHQPLYVDPENDQLLAPWVRAHATKDYYTMPAILAEYPHVHCTINLTPVLLLQLQEYYVKRLKGFRGLKNASMKTNPLAAGISSKTDPWIDLALKETAAFEPTDLSLLFRGNWNAFSVGEGVLKRFPEYAKLKKKWTEGREALTQDDVRRIKFFFLLANFHPMFLKKKVRLPDGNIIDLRRIVEHAHDGTCRLKREVSEKDCRYIVVEAFKIMMNIIPIHKKLMYYGESGKGRKKFSGQIELTTAPFYHPILPLVWDSDVAHTCQPMSSLPKRFHFAEDVDLHVKLAIRYFKNLYGASPNGMWPAEGGVSHEVLSHFSKYGVQWIATDEKILARSKPGGLSKYKPHVVQCGGSSKDEVVIFFRDTELSDRIGFVYKDYHPHTAVDDFVRTLMKHVPAGGEDDRVLTVILDGENAWEWYRYDPEGEKFLRGIYHRLSEFFSDGKVVTITPTEYLEGNSRRGIYPHPIPTLPKIDWLWPGSWINANFDTWIGENQKNTAWNLLREARLALEKSGVSPRCLSGKAPAEGTKKWYARKAWQELLAAEGSDWFWWIGTELDRSGKPGAMAELFIKHVKAVYDSAGRAGASVSMPELSVLFSAPEEPESLIGAMRRSEPSLVTVRFQCDARGLRVADAIYVTGSHVSLGNWQPNKIRMFDDGTHGDKKAGDGIWTLEVQLPADTEITYKFTNSGSPGKWDPGDEMPGVNRRFRITPSGETIIELYDVFGRL